ncbi:ABC transporter [Enemella dayhoffiae]|uniref:ABC transporter n=1 Tax=Enemella dayhoffiae TaxID=2016507 RepID=A0A255H1Z5_9ACTN|nr:ATP-binding cassette domain-containing protein [Enemella dayhoffiae]OYO21622.1 ABC transporter [Enemella dayhoffiae]
MNNLPPAGWAIEIDGLVKRYRSRGGTVAALAGLTMRVPNQGVHGFLGPNGSGKSTTIRALLGLVRPNAGRMWLLGEPVPQRLPGVIGRVGAIVERPRFFPEFDGHKNLRLLADSIGAPRTRVDEALEQVGLTLRGRDRYHHYSLGMKQRLAIAATLLKDPQLLIFDEPTNGLDPSGIRAVRQTVRRLADQGRAVLVSSHLIGELEQVVDSVTVIRAGRTIAEGALGEVLGNRLSGIWVRVAEPERAARVLRDHGWAVAVRPRGLEATGDFPAYAITQQLAAHDLWVEELHPIRVSLEERFLQLTAAPAPTIAISATTHTHWSAA